MSLKDIRPALRSFVLADATIAALVSTRMYPVVLPQGIRSTSIVTNEVSAVGDHHNEGPSGLAQVRMQIAAWGVDPDAAHALAVAIKNRIDGYRGLMGSGSSEVDMQGVFFDNWRDLYDGTAKMFGKVADYFIHYSER